MNHNLTPSSYIVLSLLSRFGPATLADLKEWADGSVGYFWSFSQSPLADEPERLVHLGLLSKTHEATGEGRAIYSITDSGRAAVSRWLQEATPSHAEFRDLGLLKLYFAQIGTQQNLTQLIQDQLAAHRRRLAEYERIAEELSDLPEWVFYRATARMGLLYERTALNFWEELAANPPDVSV